MALFSRLAGGFRALVRRADVEQELDEELREYIDEAVARRVAGGMSREDAMRAVRAETGSVDAVKDRVRDVGWESIAYSVWQDIRFALRMLGRKPGFGAAAIATLALGIGGTTAVFSVVDALFVRAPAGVADPRSVRRIFIERDAGSLQSPGGWSGSWADYQSMRQNAPAFAGVAAYIRPENVDLGRGASAEQVVASVVSQEFFHVLGVRPALGRVFLVEEDRVPGAHPVCLISHAMWQTRFGGLRDVLGKTLLVNGVSIEIIGVTPRGFHGIDPEAVDIWLPSSMAARLGIHGFDRTDDWRFEPNALFAFYVARLSSVAEEAAKAQAARALARAAEGNEALDPTPGIRTAPLVLAVAPGARATDLALWLTVVASFVLLIACGNVANLLLARALARRRELAVRLSLGAGPGRIIRQHLTESVVLALIGGAAGVLVALWGMRLMQQFPLPPSAGRVDGRLLLFALAVSIATGVLFGILPALRAVAVDPVQSLKESRTAGARTRTLTRNGLLVAQITLSLVLLVGAGLFVRSLHAATSIQSGVDVDRLVIATIDLRRNKFPPEAREEFYAVALERLANVPAVQRASIAHFEPFSGLCSVVPFIRPGDEKPDLTKGACLNLIGPDYFATTGTRLLHGREIGAGDTRDREQVGVVNEPLARLLVDNGNPVGLCIAFNLQVRNGGCTRIVGVVAAQRDRYLDPESRPTLFRPRAQIPYAVPFGIPSLVVRTQGDPYADGAAVRAVLQGQRPDLPYALVEPLAEETRADMLPYRLGAMLFGMFGVLALVLAAVGLYGVLGYFVTERTTEIGIRRSLGAPASAVIALVARQGLIPVSIGITAGLGVAFAGTRLLASLLFGIDARDPIAFTSAALFLSGVACLAILVPAFRAARVDPLIALKHE
jgi:predicted permease